MSIRIAGDGLEGALAPQISKTQDTARVAGSSPSGTTKAGGSGGDSVEISGLSTSLAKAGAADDARVDARVSVLRAMYARGDYQPDSAQLSQALVSHALGGAVEGPKA
jgi:hypothetical protein